MSVIPVVRRYFTVRAVAMLVLTSVALVGCGGGCIQIPPVDFTVTLMEDVSVPGLGPLAWIATVQNQEIPLPETCDLPDVGDYRQELVDAVGEFLAGLITIDRVDLTKVVFAASEGDFHTLTRLRMVLVVGAAEYDLGTADSASGLGSRFELVPPAAIDLMEVLDGVSCISAVLFVDGSPPETSLTFDVDAELEVTASLF